LCRIPRRQCAWTSSADLRGAKLALGKQADHLADYFDACRRKRNEIDYTGATIATTTEAEELLLHAKAFLSLVESWIASTHPALKA